MGYPEGRLGAEANTLRAGAAGGGDSVAGSGSSAAYGLKSGPSAKASALGPTPRGVWRHAWETWKRISLVMGAFFGRVWLTVLYFTVVVPFALLLRFISGPFSLRARAGHDLPQWKSTEGKAADLNAARRQG